MVDEEGLLTHRLPAVPQVLYGHLVQVEGAGEEEEQPSEVVGPEAKRDLGVPKTVETGGEEGKDEDEVAVDPDSVGQVVVKVPVDAQPVQL